MDKRFKVIFVSVAILALFSAFNVALWHIALFFTSNNSASAWHLLNEYSSNITLLTDHLLARISNEKLYYALSSVSLLPTIFLLPIGSIKLTQFKIKIPKKQVTRGSDLNWAGLFVKIDSLEASLLEKEEIVNKLQKQIQEEKHVAYEMQSKTRESLMILAERSKVLTSASNKITAFTKKIDLRSRDQQNLSDYIEVYNDEQSEFNQLLLDILSKVLTSESKNSDNQVKIDMVSDAMMIDEIRKTAQFIIKKYPVKKIINANESIKDLKKRSIRLHQGKELT